jgi:hypothetical protein
VNSRVTIRPGAVTWSTSKPPMEPVSVVIGGVRVTVEPVDAKPQEAVASGDPFEQVQWK